MPSERDEHKTATAASRTKRSRSKSKKRTPLANLTNAPVRLKLAKPTDPPPCTSVRGPRFERHGVLDSASVVAASPPRGDSSNLGSGGDAVNRDEPEPLTNTEHIARGIQSSGKKPCTSSSCPPVQRIKSVNKDKLMDDTYNDRRKALSVQLQKPKKKQKYAVTEALKKPTLPRDFVEKQRAYFAEIDAFELPEEVVSESELE